MTGMTGVTEMKRIARITEMTRVTGVIGVIRMVGMTCMDDQYYWDDYVDRGDHCSPYQAVTGKIYCLQPIEGLLKLNKLLL